VIFGRHPHSDIVFPEDEKSVDLVSLILYNFNDNYYAIDCSTRGYCGILVGKRNIIPVHQGMLISIAKTTLFHVENINHEYQSNNDLSQGDTNTWNYDEMQTFALHSNLFLKCLDGPFKDQSFKLPTRTKSPQERKNVHIVGRGGLGYSPDLFLPTETGVGRKHCEFRFIEEENKWVLEDENSLNGTYILFKTLEEYKLKRYSNLSPIFSRISSISDCTLLISRYIFYISKQNP
jgi:FHA domain